MICTLIGMWCAWHPEAYTIEKCFYPRADITAYELAVIVKNGGKDPVLFRPGDWASLPAGVTRHFGTCEEK